MPRSQTRAQCSQTTLNMRGKQASNGPEGTPMGRLAAKLMVPELTQHFYEYLRGLEVGPVSLAEIARFPTPYYTKLTVPVAQFQGKGIQMQNVWWTAGQPFRRLGKPSADWVWVRHRGCTKAANGELDGKIVGKLEGLFSMRDRIDMMHDVGPVSLLSLRGSSKPGGEEGMVRMGRRNGGRKLRIVPIGDIEGMAHLIGLKQDSLWLVKNGIDLNSLNELYD